VPDPSVHLDLTSSIPHNSEREQDAEKALQRKKTVIWFVWFVSFVWLVKPGQLDELNKPDEPSNPNKPDQPVSRGYSLSIAEADRKVEGAVYAAKQGVV